MTEGNFIDYCKTCGYFWIMVITGIIIVTNGNTFDLWNHWLLLRHFMILLNCGITIC